MKSKKSERGYKRDNPRCQYCDEELDENPPYMTCIACMQADIRDKLMERLATIIKQLKNK